MFNSSSMIGWERVLCLGCLLGYLRWWLISILQLKKIKRVRGFLCVGWCPLGEV